MSYQALLFCTDEKTIRAVSQILSELEFQVESCTEPFAAVKKVTAQHFDAILVDCDNEQNAALLFKSARHSSLNQSSLAVALVQGQAGIAKSFRIGANLVLTKPIHVEQSKATLRTAKGLLRKGDGTKPVAAASSFPNPPAVSAPKPLHPVSFPKSAPVTPIFTSAPASSGLAVGPVASASLEVEKEPTPKLAPEEAALLESLPDPLSKHVVSLETVSVASKSYPWQPVSKIDSPPQDTTLELNDSELDEIVAQLGSAPPGASANQPLHNDSFASRGTAAAAAPARVSSDEEQLNREIAAAEAEFSTPIGQLLESEPQSLPQESTASFSALSAYGNEFQEDSSGRGKTFVVVALVAAGLACGAYFGWSRLHPAATQPPAVAIAPPVPAPEPVATTEATTPSDIETQTPNTEQQITIATAGAQPQDIAADSNAPQGDASPAARQTIPASTSEKPSAGSPVRTPKVNPPQEVIIVKSGTSVPAPAPRPVTETPAPPEIGSTHSEAGGNPLAGIAAAQPTKPVFKPVHISEGISAGLLIKKVQPVYPAAAKQMRTEGTVQMEATIGKDGSIANLKVINGKPMLATAAVEAVQQWKYKPYYLNNEPTEVQTAITVEFKLPN